MESSGEIEHSEMRDFVERMHGRLIYWTDDGEQLLARLCCMDEFLFANSYGQIIQFTRRLFKFEHSSEHSIQCALIVEKAFFHFSSSEKRCLFLSDIHHLSFLCEFHAIHRYHTKTPANPSKSKQLMPKHKHLSLQLLREQHDPW